MKIDHGNKIGGKQGFPTLNIYKNLPLKYPSGVYFVELVLNNKKEKGLLFYKKNFKRIEIHLIDFNKNVYEDNIEILNDKTIMLFDIKDNYISPNNYKFLPKICYIIIV